MAAFARGNEAEVFRADDLEWREGIVDLRAVDIRRRNSGHPVRFARGDLGRGKGGQRFALAQTDRCGALAKPRDD